MTTRRGVDLATVGLTLAALLAFASNSLLTRLALGSGEIDAATFTGIRLVSGAAMLAAYLPGRIKTAARHPMLLAVKFWAVAHLLANGTLADALLFGGFLAWAVADRISLSGFGSK